MWTQNYAPLAGSIPLSAVAAALPVFALLYLLGLRRKPAWIAAVSGLAVAVLVALLVYHMPPRLLASSAAYGAAFGLFPIGWILFWAVFLYRLTLETGHFEIIKDSIGGITEDQRLQALLIGFAFGAFLEGAAGFGAPVAVAAAMLTGLGFTPFYAAGLCLLANTAPVAFGSIGIPVATLAGITGLSAHALSASVGRICAPVSLFIPAYLVLVMRRWRGLRAVLPAAASCGIAFAATQFLVSNFIGPQLTDILSSLAAIGVLLVVLHFWRPSEEDGEAPGHAVKRHAAGTVALAWTPFAFLVCFVLLWGLTPVKARLSLATLSFPWPGLDAQILRIAPAVARSVPYAAIYGLDWLASSGTACACAALLAAVVLRVSPRKLLKIFWSTWRQLALSMFTIAAVLALAFQMNYSGATATLGLAFAATGAAFPFFSALLGWVGVFLTGSDTSANALFGNLQVVTAGRLGLDPVLMAAANSCGGVMGKMISLQSIAVAAAASGMAATEEARLFRFTLRHSLFLASVIGLITVAYAYL